MVEVQINLLSEPLVQYLYLKHLADDESFKTIPVIKNGGLAVENGTTEIPRDYFLGRLDARKKCAIQNKYSRIEEVRFCDLSTGSDSILNLMTKYRINIEYSVDTVTAYCADFVSTEHIDHFGLAILKTALKCALRANTVNVDEETIAVVQKYVDNLKKELLKQLKS